MSGVGEDVYCTLVMSDSYLPGALVLAHSLRDAGTKKKLAALITLDTLSANTVTKLKEQFEYLLPVERIANPNPGNLFLMDRGDLLFTFTKIALWRQIQFRKIIYIDADAVVLRAPDELFNLDVPFAAAPDIGWPDAFNTGVMMLKPNMGDYWALQTHASIGDSFDGADQGLLNQYFEHRTWHRLSFAYNCTPNAQYQWEPAYRFYKSNISVAHFIGKNKPWQQEETMREGPGVYNELLSRWWAVYDRHLRETVESRTSDLPGSTSAQPTPAASRDIPSITTERPFTEPEDSGEYIRQSISEPTTASQFTVMHYPSQPEPTPAPRQPFVAPRMEWDATRTAPPSVSTPEAPNFPTQRYGFSNTRALFQPPPTYPEPPKDMYYQVPASKTTEYEKPTPVFPWEREREMPKATRVFAEDFAPPPALAPAPEPSTVAATGESQEESEATALSELASSPTDPLDEPMKAFQQSANAWDNVPGIEHYVRAVINAQRRTPAGAFAGSMEELFSPTEATGKKDRKASLILTDFPTEFERPSLPVTPAPIRRPTFWGEERDDAGELPAAEGVPAQTEWDPQAQLESLRRGSLLELEHLKQASDADAPTEASHDAEGRRLSDRSMPEHAASVPALGELTMPPKRGENEGGDGVPAGTSLTAEPSTEEGNGPVAESGKTTGSAEREGDVPAVEFQTAVFGNETKESEGENG